MVGGGWSRMIRMVSINADYEWWARFSLILLHDDDHVSANLSAPPCYQQWREQRGETAKRSAWFGATLPYVPDASACRSVQSTPKTSRSCRILRGFCVGKAQLCGCFLVELLWSSPGNPGLFKKVTDELAALEATIHLVNRLGLECFCLGRTVGFDSRWTFKHSQQHCSWTRSLVRQLGLAVVRAVKRKKRHFVTCFIVLHHLSSYKQPSISTQLLLQKSGGLLPPKRKQPSSKRPLVGRTVSDCPNC